MKQIELTQDYFALIDDEDYELVAKYCWRVVIKERTQEEAAIAYNNKAIELFGAFA